MTAFGTIRLIAEREVRARLASKAYVRSTVALSVLLAALALLPVLVGGGDDDGGPVAAEQVTIGIVGSLSPSARDAIDRSLSLVAYDKSYVDLADQDAAEAALSADEVDVVVAGDRRVVVDESDVFGEPPAYAYALADALTVAFFVDRAQVGPGLAGDLTGAPTIPVTVLEAGDEAATGARFLVANLGAVFLYGTLIMYGMWIVNGVIEEKSNRVVEMLLATVRPLHLMAGKVLGLGVLGVGQVIIMFAPAAVIGVTQVDFLREAGVGSAVAWVAVWWLLGYTLYSVLLAGVGSLVSRPEEAQTVATPVNLLLIVAYIVSIIGLNDPDGTLMQVASFVPFSAPLAMLLRQVVGEPAGWEVAASIGLMVVATIGATFVGARLYEGAILRVGSRVAWRQAWRRAV